MPVSHNGWPVITRGWWQLPAITGSVLAGPVWVVMFWLSREYARRVEPINRSQSWGYSHRRIGGSSTWSNHASGTAVDFNAPRHPLGTRAEQNFTAGQIRACERILADSRGVLRWLRGHDPMHWEIAKGVKAAQVQQLATRILQDALGVRVDGVRGPATLAALRSFQQAHGLTVDGIDGPATWTALTAAASAPPRSPAPQAGRRVLRYDPDAAFVRGDDVRALQEFARRVFPDYGAHLTPDGVYGPATAGWVREFQSRAGVTVDGIVGRATWAALERNGFR